MAHLHHIVTDVLPPLIVHPQVRITVVIFYPALRPQGRSVSLSGIHNAFSLQFRTERVKDLRPMENRTVEIHQIMSDETLDRIMSRNVHELLEATPRHWAF